MSEQIIDNKDCLAPSEIAHEFSDKIMAKKAQLCFKDIMLLAVAAGAFIAFGAHGCLTVMTGTTEALGWGFAKFLGGIIFSSGLMMVALTGAELFTGDILMAFSVFEKKVSILKLFKCWTLVYIGNFIGALVLAMLIFYSGAAHSNNDALGKLALTTAYSKIDLTFLEAFTRGILCNWLVCLAVWMATSSKRVVGKIFAIFFPITTFVASGYEHSVANMFFIPNGIMMKSIPSVVEVSGLTAEQLSRVSWQGFVDNLIPVTLGNIIGAVVFVVLLFWLTYLKKTK